MFGNRRQRPDCGIQGRRLGVEESGGLRGGRGGPDPPETGACRAAIEGTTVRRLSALILAIVALAGVGAWRFQEVRAERAQEARDLLLKAMGPGQRLDLEGEQVISTAGIEKAVRARILRSREGKMQIKYLDGELAGAKVWDNGTLAWRSDPNHKKLTVSACRRVQDPLSGGRLALLLKNYEPRLAGEAMIAGLPTTVLDLKPRHAGNPWQRLWVYRTNGAVLASTRFDTEGRALRSTRYANVRFALPDWVEPDTFEPCIHKVTRHGGALPGDSTSPFKARELVDIVSFPVRLPTYVPAGYEFVAGYPFPCDCGHQAARLQYTDGLNTITILECGHGCAGMPSPEKSGAVVRLRGQEMQLIATGELRRAELEKMVRSALDAQPVAYPKTKTTA